MPRGHFKPFTETDEQKIKAEYLIKPMKRLAAEIGCTGPRISRYLKNNNLIIPEHIIEARKLIGRRKPGDIPFNKGLKQEDYMSAEAISQTKKTRFKKGNIPHNTNKIGNGAIVTRRDKNGYRYKYIRVKLGVWQLYHRVKWERLRGKIPDGYIIIFIDGDSENTDIENLKIISKVENMYRNSKMKHHPDIIPSLVLINQLENKLKDMENEK